MHPPPMPIAESAYGAITPELGRRTTLILDTTHRTQPVTRQACLGGERMPWGRMSGGLILLTRLTSLRNIAGAAGIAAIAAILLAACSSGSDPGGHPEGASVEPPPGFTALYPNERAALADWASMERFQRDLLEDGEISFADYEAAVFGFAQCVEESGLEFGEQPMYNAATRKFEYSILTGTTMDEARSGSAKIGNCATSYLSSIQAVWNWNNRPTEGELQQAGVAWKACLRDGGEPEDDITSIPEWGTTEFDVWVNEHLREEAMNPSVDIPTWRRCLDEVKREYPSG